MDALPQQIPLLLGVGRDHSPVSEVFFHAHGFDAPLERISCGGPHHVVFGRDLFVLGVRSRNPGLGLADIILFRLLF